MATKTTTSKIQRGARAMSGFSRSNAKQLFCFFPPQLSENFNSHINFNFGSKFYVFWCYFLLL